MRVHIRPPRLRYLMTKDAVAMYSELQRTAYDGNSQPRGCGGDGRSAL
jgi:hypothetical protein